MADISHIYFGGSFFPPHRAHTEMIRQALQYNSHADLVIVPTKQNPLKDTPGAERALIQAWLDDLESSLSEQNFSRCCLETIEMDSDADKNFTVETLQKIIQPHQKWALLMGSDSAEHFAQWKNPSQILAQLAAVWIVPRGKFSGAADEAKLRKIFHAVNAQTPVTFLHKVSEISSSEIRNGSLDQHSNEATSQSPDDFLSPRVLSVWKQLASS